MRSPDPASDLGSRTSEDVGRTLLLVPVGSLEQHGPHLPLAVDTMIAAAIAAGLAERHRRAGGEALVAPPVSFGASGEHEGFPGTISIGTAALAFALLELGRSASAWAERIVFVNGHGGNLDALGDAVPRLRDEGRDAAWLPCATPGGDAHAGRTETSLMACLVPAGVRWDRVAPGETAPLAELLPRLRAGGVRAVSESGVLGDPTGASAAEGRALLDHMIDTAWERLTRGRVSVGGCLALGASA